MLAINNWTLIIKPIGEKTSKIEFSEFRCSEQTTCYTCHKLLVLVNSLAYNMLDVSKVTERGKNIEFSLKTCRSWQHPVGGNDTQHLKSHIGLAELL